MGKKKEREEKLELKKNKNKQFNANLKATEKPQESLLNWFEATIDEATIKNIYTDGNLGIETVFEITSNSGVEIINFAGIASIEIGDQVLIQIFKGEEKQRKPEWDVEKEIWRKGLGVCLVERDYEKSENALQIRKLVNNKTVVIFTSTSE